MAATSPPRERLSQMMSSLVSAQALDAGAGDARVGPHRRRGGGQRASGRSTGSRRRAPGVPGLRVRRRRRRPARQRHVRRGDRLSASVRAKRPAPGPPRGASASSTSCSRADGRSTFHTKKYGTFAAMHRGLGHHRRISAPSSSPGWPSARRKAERAAPAAQRPPSTTSSRPGVTELLVPARYGGMQAPFPAILDPVRRMAHGCASSAWTLGFYALHNWMLALFGEQRPGGGVRDAPVPGARSPGADRPRRARRRRHPADRDGGRGPRA